MSERKAKTKRRLLPQVARLARELRSATTAGNQAEAARIGGQLGALRSELMGTPQHRQRQRARQAWKRVKEMPRARS